VVRTLTRVAAGAAPNRHDRAGPGDLGDLRCHQLLRRHHPGSASRCGPASSGGAIDSSPAVANGVVFVGGHDDDKLFAFDANGVTNCSGTPTTCSPLWTATTGSDIQSSPAVANGVLYVGSWDHNFYAYDAAGMTNCSGTPKTCGPLWSFTSGMKSALLQRWKTACSTARSHPVRVTLCGRSLGAASPTPTTPKGAAQTVRGCARRLAMSNNWCVAGGMGLDTPTPDRETRSSAGWRKEEATRRTLTRRACHGRRRLPARTTLARPLEQSTTGRRSH
jgi:hypothetical protein